MKKNKIIIFLTVFFFAAVTLYLCPCASATTEKNSLSFVKAANHDCCDKMPSCPLEKESKTGIQSLIPTFINTEVTNIVPPEILLADVLYALFSPFEATPHPSLVLSIMEKEFLLKSSPDLFIQYATLRI